MWVRHVSPVVERNRGPIRAVLRRVLPVAGTVLEVASGTGEHAVHFAAALPGLRWQPTDPDERSRWSITSWIEHSGLTNVAPPLALDTRAAWPMDAADAVVAINMVHISPWPATVALLAGAARVLPPGGPLVLYGPYRVDGVHTSPGNTAFDAALRERDPTWGIRDVGAVVDAAAEVGLVLVERVPMPANNQSLVFERSG